MVDDIVGEFYGGLDCGNIRGVGATLCFVAANLLSCRSDSVGAVALSYQRSNSAKKTDLKLAMVG